MAPHTHPARTNGRSSLQSGRITTALMLAAGKGTRLRPVAGDIPKCLVDLNGKPLLAHAIKALENNGFKRLVIVTGYRRELIEDFLDRSGTTLTIETIFNEHYDSVNNIHSLWLAGKSLNEPFLLLESDLVFEPESLAGMIYPDCIALDRFNPEIHSGTTAKTTECGHLKSLFLTGSMTGSTPSLDSTHKTVNMYSFSLQTWNKLQHQLKRHLDTGNLDSFYELAIRDLVDVGAIRLKVADFSSHWWDEIDSVEDLMRVHQRLNQPVWH